MAPKPRKKPGADVQLDDPTDFHAPSLRALDHSLRCSLCQELFTAPVLLTPCSHSFDSLCVREHLAETKRCPVCHVEANEDKIKPVHQLEEAVRLWKAARTDILALQAAALSRPSPAAGPSSSSSSPTPIAGPSRSTSTSNSTTFPVSFKPLPSSDRKGKRKAVDPPNGKVKRKGKEVEVEELTLADSDDEDDDVVIEGGSPPRKRSKSGKGNGKETGRAKTPKKEEVDSAEGGDPEDPNLIVSCPICSSLVKNAHIAPHIDSGCKKGRIKPESLAAAEKGGGGSAWSRLLSSGGGGGGRAGGGEKGKGTPSSESEIENEMDTTQPLPLKNYTGKTLRDLTKMLTDYHLPLTLPSSTPSSASLSTYTTRHQHFTRLWNANADIPRSSPAHKSARELRAELEGWEKGRERARREEEGKRKKEVGENETNQQWLELIAQARESALKMREQQKAATTAPAAQQDEDTAMADGGALSSVTIPAVDETAAFPPPPESADAKSPSPAPPPPPAATRKRSVRILSPVRSSPPAPPPPADDLRPSSPHNQQRQPPSRSPSFSPPSFLREDDSLAYDDDAEEDDLRSLLAEKKEWAASEKQKKEKQRVREKREEERELSPFNPEPPRPSQRNREEERMFAELAAEREANGLAEDEEDEEDEE